MENLVMWAIYDPKNRIILRSLADDEEQAWWFWNGAINPISKGNFKKHGYSCRKVTITIEELG